MNLNLSKVFHNFKTHLARTGTPTCMCICCIQWSGTGPPWEIRWIIVASIQLQIVKDMTGQVLVQSAQNTSNPALPLLPLVDISFMGNASRNLSQQVAMSVPCAGGLQWPSQPLKLKGAVHFQPHSVKLSTMYSVGLVIYLVTAGGIPTMNTILQTMHYVLLQFIKPCDDKYPNTYAY